MREVTFGRDPHDDEEPIEEGFRESSVRQDPAWCVCLRCRGEQEGVVRGAGKGQVWSSGRNPPPRSCAHPLHGPVRPQDDRWKPSLGYTFWPLDVALTHLSVSAG